MNEIPNFVLLVPCFEDTCEGMMSTTRPSRFPSYPRTRVSRLRINLDSRCHGNDDQEKVEFESTQTNSLPSITRNIGVERNRAC